MFSVVTPRIWVSPRSNSAEPWARGITATSAESDRMSVRPRPSMRILSVRTRLRMTFLDSALNAAPISFSRPSKASPSLMPTFSSTAALTWSVAASRSCL